MKKQTHNPTPQLCPIARQCGSCSAIDVPYPDQLRRKQQRVKTLFADAFGDCDVRPIIGMEDPFHYRNKIATPFAPGRKTSGGGPSRKKGKGSKDRREVLCGMYASGTHRIIEVPDCKIENPLGRRIIAAVRAIMTKYDVLPYDEDAGTGFMRHCIVRVGHESGEVLVTLVTNAREFPSGRNFARELVKRCPEITTVVQNINTQLTNALLGREEHTLYGPGFILDTLCGLSFRISSHSFYQVNSTQTEVLYRTAVDLAGLSGDDVVGPTVMDAYCGTGTIGLVAASSCSDATIIGVDNVASAIRDARQNALHNGIDNARFLAQDAGAYMRERASKGASIDILLMDPPRAGSSTEFLQATCSLAPRRIVYISCNPETQVRDISYLVQHGYRLDRVQPVDMFPHTPHIETVAALTLV